MYVMINKSFLLNDVCLLKVTHFFHNYLCWLEKALNDFRSMILMDNMYLYKLKTAVQNGAEVIGQ